MTASERVRALLREAVPHIDPDMLDYIASSVEEPGIDVSSDNLYDLVGPFLSEVCEDDEEVHSLCVQISNELQRYDQGLELKNNVGAVADAPTDTGSELKKLGEAKNLGELAKELTKAMVHVSVMDAKAERASQVDQDKLAKTQDKLKNKAEKREQKEMDAQVAADARKKREEQEERERAEEDRYRQHIATQQALAGEGAAKLGRDIKLENFDLSHYGKTILKDASLTLAYGRHYGLVGRNGIGKTTLLKAVARRELPVPAHIRILHVEQEMPASDISALDAVLSADIERARLIEEEKRLTSLVDKSTDDAKRLVEVYARLGEIEADKAVARASVILHGLGFPPERQSWPTKSFSGGWRMRISLAQALFSKPDLLLLDEPTNMLDLEAVIWLEGYLAEWESTLLVVSHDREFLNTVATDILHLHSEKVDSYKGDYDTFEKTKAESLLNQQREYENQMNYRQHLQDFIDRWRYNAKRASLAQSKIKILEKLPVLRSVVIDPPVRLRFTDPEPLAPPLVQLDDVDFKYTDAAPIVLKGVNFGVRMESRIGVVGVNGSGKSTLLKLFTGDLEPTTGDCKRNPKLRIGYFTQHFVDQLDFTTNPLMFLKDRFPGQTQQDYRRHLGSFGITGDLAVQQIGTLSGGQKCRVAFTVLSMLNPHILILDEPTNHLDMETIDALAEACNAFKGGVLLVSHDQRLLSLVAKELWVADQGHVSQFDGEFADYKRIIASRLKAP